MGSPHILPDTSFSDIGNLHVKIFGLKMDKLQLQFEIEQLKILLAMYKSLYHKKI